MMKFSSSKDVFLLLGAAFAAMLVFYYIFVYEREWSGELLRALFGLAGGTTAGG
jgi:hypothetical protein